MEALNNFMKKKNVSRSKLKATMPFAVARFDREMGKYRSRHWEHFRDWMGWKPKKEKENNE